MNTPSIVCLKSFTDYRFEQLPIFEDGRTPLYLTEEQYNAIRELVAQAGGSPDHEPAAYLHQVVCGDGEPDQALSFEADSFPLYEALGFRSMACEPLFKQAPAAQDVAGLVDVATGKVQHVRNGMCPDQIEGFEVSDPDCPACRIIAAHLAQQGGE